VLPEALGSAVMRGETGEKEGGDVRRGGSRG